MTAPGEPIEDYGVATNLIGLIKHRLHYFAIACAIKVEQTGLYYGLALTLRGQYTESHIQGRKVECYYYRMLYASAL